MNRYRNMGVEHNKPAFSPERLKQPRHEVDAFLDTQIEKFNASVSLIGPPARPRPDPIGRGSWDGIALAPCDERPVTSSTIRSVELPSRTCELRASPARKWTAGIQGDR
jgi:hypothetical protein